MFIQAVLESIGCAERFFDSLDELFWLLFGSDFIVDTDARNAGGVLSQSGQSWPSGSLGVSPVGWTENRPFWPDAEPV